MNDQTFSVLEFNRIKELVAEFALTDSGKNKIINLQPSINKNQILSWMEEVSEAVKILNKSSSVPIHGLDGIENILKHLHKGVPLRPDQFVRLLDFLDCSVKIRRFMKDKEYIAPRVSAYVYSIDELPYLTEEITRCIRNGGVDDYATKDLLKIRKQIAIQEERLKEKLAHILKSNKYKAYIQEAVISQRYGRYVIPVKKEYKNKISGSVLDSSASGATLYIEPDEITSLQEQLNYLKMDEQAEMDQVLFYLTGMVEEHEREILLSVETMVHYDALFAKAKYSRLIDGNQVQINEDHYIHLKNAKHPLLGDTCVPLSMTLGEGAHALVITGPNTGGKTVTIKTVGLLTIMVQSGLHIPVEAGSSIALFHKILVDIGDGQSIEQNLSTFSSRIVNIIDILKESNDRTLVLLDELGSGTDPAEGMGLATAILEQLYLKGVTLLATTHYSEIKEFANNQTGFMNGSMEFDLNTLRPTYRLQIGKEGDSQAFAIALKLGIHPKIIERAHEITYKEEKSYHNSDEDSNNKRELDKQIIINRHANRKKSINRKTKTQSHTFQQGDSVKVSNTEEVGIVYKGPDESGTYIIQIKGRKETVNQKRLQLLVSASELYPPDYDFDIIFESKENRKKSKIMDKRYVEGLTIEHENL